MCGICGIVNFKNDFETYLLVRQMMKSIKHRGPDGEGCFVENNVALGHVRLSIIDLSEKANQPMLSYDNNLIIIYNGEIYNYQEIKKKLTNKYKFITNSDTEVILYAYMEWGEECLHKFNGMFAFVIYDKSKQNLFVARDRYGIKPFYYFHNSNYFIFGSEIKAILQTGICNPMVNEEMLYDFIAFKFTDHSKETCFKDVFNLLPGHKLNLNVKTGKIAVAKWYFLPDIEIKQKHDLQHYACLLNEAINNSVSLHLVSDVPVGLALSGGLDSSSIAVMMKKQISYEIEFSSFSAIYDEKWEKDEKKYIDILTNNLNIKANYTYPTAKKLLTNLDKLIYHQEEPFGTAALFASWCVYEEANKNNIKVLLNGQGADELFGYNYMAAFYFYELLIKFKLIKAIREIYLFNKKQIYHNKFTFTLLASLFMPEYLKNKTFGTFQPIINKDFYNKYKTRSNVLSSFFNTKSFAVSVKNHLLYKLQHLLRVEDKNSMTFSVEARVPFLEHNLVELSYNIPSEYKIKNGETKYILKQAMKHSLPEPIYKRTDKIGYETPMDKWFREKDFINYIDDMLNSPEQPMYNYLNIDYVKNKWNKHKANIENNGQIIWKYVYLTQWYNVFFK